MYRNRGNRTRGEGALRQNLAHSQRMMTNLSAQPAVNNMGPMNRSGSNPRKIPWRRNPGSSRPTQTQPYQVPVKLMNLNEQCFDFGAKSQYLTECAETKGAYKNPQNSREQRLNFDDKNRFPRKYAEMNGTYKNTQNSHEQLVDFDAKSRFPTEYDNMSRTCRNSQNSREHYLNPGAKRHASTEYAQTNGTYENPQNLRWRQRIRKNVENVPYRVPTVMQIRGQERGYTAKTEPEYTKETRILEKPKQQVRKIWKTEIQPKNISEVAPVQAADIESKSISNFISPSPWFSGAEAAKSSYQKKQPEIQSLLALDLNDIFNKPISKPDAFRSTVGSGYNISEDGSKTLDSDINHLDDSYSENIAGRRWEKPDFATKTLHDDIVNLDDPYYKNTVGGRWDTSDYTTKTLQDNEVHVDDSGSKNTVGRRWNRSDYAPKELHDGTVHLDDSYSKNPLKTKWIIPPELNLSIESGEFFAKVCEAVLEKVLLQLCPKSTKRNQKPGAQPVYYQKHSNHDGDIEKNVVNGSSLLQNEISQRSGYVQYNNKSRFNEDYKRYAPKPLFRQPQGVNSSGRIGKRKILTKNGKSLIYV